jgi:hypothetical protein
MKVWKKLGSLAVKAALTVGSNADAVGLPKIIGIPVSKACDSIIEKKRIKRRERKELEASSTENTETIPENTIVFEHSIELIQQQFRFKSSGKEIKAYILEHNLADFLVWIQQPIIDVCGDVKKSLQLCSEGLVLTLFLNLENSDELEDSLFEQFDNFDRIDNALRYIDIDFR